MSDDTTIEQAIQAKGLNAPRVTPEDIDNSILAGQYFVFPGTTVTVCCLTLRNGFNVLGHSAAASPDNFDEQIGREIAFRNARQQIWALEGYLLRQRLADGQPTKLRIGEATLSWAPQGNEATQPPSGGAEAAE